MGMSDRRPMKGCGGAELRDLFDEQGCGEVCCQWTLPPSAKRARRLVRSGIISGFPVFLLTGIDARAMPSVTANAAGALVLTNCLIL